MDVDPAALQIPHRVSARALDWLESVRSCFALDADLPVHEIDGPSLKALSELALAAGMVIREAVAAPEEARKAQSLMDFAWQQFREGDVLYELQRHTPAATHCTEIYSFFAATGYRHARLEQLLEHLVGMRAARVPEHVPNRQLAVVAAVRRIGLPDHSDLEELIGRTWLGGMPEPWMLDAFNGYGITHTVFHLTDWSAEPGRLPGKLQHYLRAWLPAWVEVFAETRGWDLLGELLAVGMCLEEPMFFPAVWEQVAQAQRADGMLPNGVTRPPDDAVLAFRNHHHPTIVAVVAGTLTASRALTVAAGMPA
ncbi:DUF6895 family protein [Streptomyces alanosinicus]|uniref:DUF6895 domain-containing protein n=1 Tax=Streptomyces alanosinicus TaxID=68171 RepID=A0A919D8B6_9ACTN|nr:hypothetical protein [Streptomyces alanosinicus]GHE12946.1 hypothetical protein GCM10010339_78280 [Streptomyces alanosinicus]